MAADLKQIADNLTKGKASEVKELVQKAPNDGVDVEKVLNEGLVAGMSVVREKFKKTNSMFLKFLLPLEL